MGRGGGYKAMGGGENVMYDDAAFELFAVAFLAALWVPWLLYRVFSRLSRARAPQPSPIELAKHDICACSACRDRALAAEKYPRSTRSAAVTSSRIWNIVFVAAGVLLAFGVVRVVRSSADDESHFDPFEILGVGEAATKRDITKAYRRLAVQLHPDKNRDDPSAGEKFIRISKAFAALTDETSKENYRRYGNPDGYIGTTLGVGLPSWVQDNSAVMLIVYVVLLAFFPIAVGLWWKRQSDLLPTSVMTNTFVLYRETLSHTQRFRDLLGAVAGSHEFADLYNPDNAELIPEMNAALKRANKDDLRKIKCVQQPEAYQAQGLLLLCLYLARLEIPPALQYALDEMLRRVDPLLTALTDTVGVFQRPDCQAAWGKHFMHGHTTYLSTCISVSQSVIQRLDKGDSPLMQIPGFTDREVRYCVGSRTHPARTVYEFMRLEEAIQRETLRAFTDDQFADVQAFCSRYPVALLELCEPTVDDDDDPTVHENDMVTVRGKVTVMRRAGSVYSPHTPNLPVKRPEVWWVSLSDQRLVCPIEVKRLMPKHARGHDPEASRAVAGSGGDSCCGGISTGTAAASSCDEDVSSELAKDPRVTVYDVCFTFTAPRAGTYGLELTAAVDCYAGCNKSKVVKMVVKDATAPDTSDNPPYFDASDESEADVSESSSDEDDDGKSKGSESDTDAEYEYIEVTDSEEEGEVSDPRAGGREADDISDDDKGAAGVPVVDITNGNGATVAPALRRRR
jgi:translocation protein SEC63